MLIEFLRIILGSSKIDKNFYNNKSFNDSSIYFSILIILITSLISIIPNNVFIDYWSLDLNLGHVKPPKIRFVILMSLIVWMVKSLYLYFVGVILFPSKGTKKNLIKIITTVGFAHSPMILNFFILNIYFWPLLIVTYIWYSINTIVGINQILNYNNIIKSFFVVMTPIILLIIYTIFLLKSSTVGNFT